MVRSPLRILAFVAPMALAGCHKPPEGPHSLVANEPAPGIYALAGDTIVVWRHVHLTDGGARFQAYSITPGGEVDYVDTPDLAAGPGDADDGDEVQDNAERRSGFALPQGEFETIRAKAALLRPASLGPDYPVGGYGGEVGPTGCATNASSTRTAGINFLNNANWGSFVLQQGCSGVKARAAAAVMADLFDRLDRAALAQTRQAQR